MGPYARISVLRPHDGDTVDFEAGYIRHLEWHRQAKDPWKWFGWTVWVGERQRSFIYATFGRSAVELDNAVSPAEDERDNRGAEPCPHRRAECRAGSGVQRGIADGLCHRANLVK